jgi:hypothetical protein
MALALGVAATAMATPAAAYCYKFKNTASTSRTLMMVGGGNFTTTIAPGTTWPERGEYCVYGTTVTVRVEQGLIDGGPQLIAGDGFNAKPSGTYDLR